MRPDLPSRALAILLFPLFLVSCETPEEDASMPEDDAPAESAAEGARTTMEGAEDLATPESVLHDPEADVYFVSNIDGEPLAKDGNGFISRLQPNGDGGTLRWVDGGEDGVTLHAPKGMAIIGDTLFVADIDMVRAFHRETGAALGERGVEGATFLNDLAAGPDGTLYVSDTGLDASFSPTGTEAVYRFDAEGPRAIAEGPALMNPNGLLVDGEELIVVPFGGNAVLRVPSDGGDATEWMTLPAGQLDGVVRGMDGALFVSSWEGGAIYRVDSDGTVTTAVEDIEAPADLGWDDERQQLLIPLFNSDAVLVEQIG